MTPPLTNPAPPTGLQLQPDMPICQQDLPLDRYDEPFRPYAEEYLALPDRTPETVLPWLDRYVIPATEHFGDSLLLLAHFYMGGDIVKLVERYGGAVADSYVLALQARSQPEKKVIVESAVHFMAETVSILAAEDQSVWITNPRAGCTMEMMAKDWMVLPIAEQLVARYGDAIATVAYMNTSGRLKALAGRTGGAVCTSSNAHHVVAATMQTSEKVFFVPDEHLGDNTAHRLGIDRDRVVVLPDARTLPRDFDLSDLPGGLERLDAAEMILWGGFCGVHTVFTTEQVAWWHDQGWEVHVHPECPLEVVLAADGAGSTKYLWSLISNAAPGSKLVIGTEGHFVRNAIEHAASRGVEVRALTDVPGASAAGCGCATMSRNDPPHLAGMLDLLRRGEAPEINRVLPGDRIDEISGQRTRLEPAERDTLVREAGLALQRMIDFTEQVRTET
ncbi:MAG: quinolinate synthetase [Planctomycetaceae bacterium]|nr:quinolinate synthetase [Planctomycetaceae bacterium]